jgi:hypothetical protein
MKYKSAYEAHRQCHRLLTEATMAGKIPSATLHEAEERARERMNDARAKLLAAMASHVPR